MKKIKLFQALFILIILGFCVSSCKLSLKESINSSERWYDKYGYVYYFKEGKLKYKSLTDEYFWEIGAYEIMKDSILINCDSNTDELYSARVTSFNSNKIALASKLLFCNRPFYVREEYIEIWKNVEEIADEEEHLKYLKIQAIPSFLSKPISLFELDTSRIVTIGFRRDNVVDTTFRIEDTHFDIIQNYSKIIPLEEYNDEYLFGITDGTYYKINIKTNKVNREIICKGTSIHGFDNMISYINSKFNRN